MTEFKPDHNIDLADLKIDMAFATAKKPGGVDLSGYPLLVYAPSQHGPGVRTEDIGVPVADIAAKAAEIPDYARLAGHFKTTPAHVEQAIAYAVAAQPKAAPAPAPTTGEA